MKKIIKLLSLLFMFAFVFCACSYVDSGVSDTTEEQLSETETIAQEILTFIFIYTILLAQIMNSNNVLDHLSMKDL